jgi:hypothetical protein
MGSSTENFKRHKNDVFIETGAYVGDGIQQALEAGFSEIISIELSDKYYQHSKKRFESNPNVKVTITSGNDNFHKRLGYKSKHTEGNAIDITLNPHNTESSNDFTSVLNKYKSSSDTDTRPWAGRINSIHVHECVLLPHTALSSHRRVPTCRYRARRPSSA